LGDPDHLNILQVNSLLNHWLDRQRRKLAPFIILNPSPLHQKALKISDKAKGKKKIHYEPVNTDDESIRTDNDGSGQGKGDGDGGASNESEDDDEDDGEKEKKKIPLKVGPPTGTGAPSTAQAVTTPKAGPSLRPETPPSRHLPAGTSTTALEKSQTSEDNLSKLSSKQNTTAKGKNKTVIIFGNKNEQVSFFTTLWSFRNV
jgi:hypothetical protein